MATMDSLIGLVNRNQRACTVLGDHGGDVALPSLWETSPSIALVILKTDPLLFILFFLKANQNDGVLSFFFKKKKKKTAQLPDWSYLSGSTVFRKGVFKL